jgi:hypothetical protein
MDAPFADPQPPLPDALPIAGHDAPDLHDAEVWPVHDAPVFDIDAFPEHEAPVLCIVAWPGQEPPPCIDALLIELQPLFDPQLPPACTIVVAAIPTTPITAASVIAFPRRIIDLRLSCPFAWFRDS